LFYRKKKGKIEKWMKRKNNDRGRRKKKVRIRGEGGRRNQFGVGKGEHCIGEGKKIIVSARRGRKKFKKTQTPNPPNPQTTTPQRQPL